MLFFTLQQRQGELLFANDDGLSAIIIVRDGDIRTLENKLNEINAHGTIHIPETNKREIHSIGKTPDEYTNYPTEGQSDYWRGGYKETYEKAYYGEETSHLSWKQLLAGLIAGFASENKDSSGHDRNAGMHSGIMDGNSDRENGRINRLNPYASLKNNQPLIILKSKSLQE